MKLQSGQTIDRYTVEAPIGAGGTAMVYRVRHTRLGTLHALKVLTLSNAAIRERMLREGQVQASLSHPNIVAVSDVLEIDGAPGLLMEYVDGPSLELALRKFSLRMGDAETLFYGIVAGVRQAHRFGLVHRDLKPANVLLLKSRQGFVPKVTDFGLAKVLETDRQIAHTRAGIAMGTPSYMAPEQIRDARMVDQRADLWSLGCLLYELMTRHRAFPGDEALPIYNAVINGRYLPPRELVPELPDRLDQAIRGCLVVDRDARIPDCDTLLEVLSGDRTWQIPGPSQAAGHEPTVELLGGVSLGPPPNAPDLPVAARAKIGGTPPPAPKRGGARGEDTTHGGIGLVPLAEVWPEEPRPDITDTVLLRPPEDGTLNASDSMALPVTQERRPDRGWGPVALLTAVAVVVGGLAALLAVTVVGSLLMMDLQSGAPSASTPSLEPQLSLTIPPEQGDFPDPDPVDPSQAVDPRQGIPPAPVPPPEAQPDPPAQRPSPRSTPAPQRAAPRPAARPRPAAPAAAGSGAAPSPEDLGDRVEVKVFSVPPTAALRLDGAPSGRTPAKLELAPGHYVIAVQSGERVGEFPVAVDPEGENKWCFAFGEIGPAGAGSVHKGNCP